MHNTKELMKTKLLLGIALILLANTIEALQKRSDRCIPPPAGSPLALNSCQLFDPWQDPTTGQPLLINSSLKYSLPLGARIGANRQQSSYIRTHTNKHHPSGGQIFPSESGLASLLNDFLTSIDKDNYFLVYFSRIHLVVLHELYQYLLKIYTTFNMTHVNSMWDYVHNETRQALNKKTMIINHLVGLIEAQSNQAILSKFPHLPQHLATRVGTMMMKQDYGADLNLMIEQQEEQLFADPKVQTFFKNQRSLYLDMFGKYLKLFKTYTETINQHDSTHGTAFMKHAKTIQKVIANATPALNKTGSTKARVDTLRNIKLINPPLFFYDEETLRGLDIIPKLASDLPKDSQSVEWPSSLVQDAISGAGITNKWGTVISNQPRAYFKDAAGNRTQNRGSAVKLFVNIPTMQNMYTQEVLSQPAWLNNSAGVILILRACLGDFTALFDPLLKDEQILDPCISCIIINAASKVGALSSNDLATTCAECKAYLSALEQVIGWKKPVLEEETPSLPPDQGLPPGGDQSGDGLPDPFGLPG